MKHAEVAQGARVVLGGGLLEPLARLDVILLHALAAGINPAEVTHGARVPLAGGLLGPFARLAVVLRHPMTVAIKESEVAHRSRIPAVCARLEQREDFFLGVGIQVR